MLYNKVDISFLPDCISPFRPQRQRHIAKTNMKNEITNSETINATLISEKWNKLFVLYTFRRCTCCVRFSFVSIIWLVLFTLFNPYWQLHWVIIRSQSGIVTYVPKRVLFIICTCFETSVFAIKKEMCNGSFWIIRVSSVTWESLN